MSHFALPDVLRFISFAGGEYNTDPNEKDESQQNLTQWGEEEWYVHWISRCPLTAG